MKIFNCIW